MSLSNPWRMRSSSVSNVDTNISGQVYFWPDLTANPDDGVTAIAEFSYRDFDIITQTYSTNFLYLVDSTAFATNLTLARNLFANTLRPNSYELTRSAFPAWSP